MLAAKSTEAESVLQWVRVLSAMPRLVLLIPWVYSSGDFGNQIPLDHTADSGCGVSATMEMGDLDASATTLVLRTSKKLTFRQMLSVLDRVCTLAECQHAYDFVYMPWTKLAIVNFCSVDTCRLAFGTSNETHIRFVGQAVIQGLEANLALFLSKSGADYLNDPGAPRIFANGQEVDMQLALNHFRVSEAARSKAGRLDLRHMAGASTDLGAFSLPAMPMFPNHFPAVRPAPMVDLRSYTSPLEEVPMYRSSTQTSEISSEAGRIYPSWEPEQSSGAGNEARSNLRGHVQDVQSLHPGRMPSQSSQPQGPWVSVRGQHLVFDL
eukprot:s1416_g12.t1